MSSTVQALSPNCLAPCWLYMDEAAPRLAPIQSMMMAEQWMLGETPWTRILEEMSTEMIHTEVTTKAVPREVSINHPENRNKGNLLHGL